MAKKLKQYVRRYTTLSSALQTLKMKKLVLLHPAKWDDSNDAYFMELYRSAIVAESVLALCCTRSTETYHHWKVFSGGMEGICLEFRREPLEAAISLIPGMRSGPVKYLKIKELKELGQNDLSRMPFIKRIGYADEREWRVIAECDDVREFIDLPIQLEWISKVIFSPWTPEPLADNIRETIRTICPDCRFSLRSSSLTNSTSWKKAGKALVRSR